MALEFQIVQAPMRLGLAEGVEPHQVPFGTLTRAENVCWSKTGLLEHRLGTRALSTAIVGGGSVSAAKRLMVRDRELALTDGTSLYSYTTAGWVSRGRIPNVGVTWTTSHAQMSNARCSDSAVAGSVMVETWVAGDLSESNLNCVLMYQVRDLDSGDLIVTPTSIPFANIHPQVRVVALGSVWAIVYVSGSGDVRCFTSAGTSMSLASDGALDSSHALDAFVMGTDFVVAYSKQGGQIGVLRASLVGTPVVAATGTTASVTDDHIVSIAIAGAAGESIYVAWGNTGDFPRVGFSVLNPSTLAETSAPSAIVSSATLESPTVTVSRNTSTACTLIFRYGTASDNAVFETRVVTNTGSSTVPGPNASGLDILSKQILVDGRNYIVVANSRFEAGVAAPVAAAVDVVVLDVTPGGTSGATPRQVGKVDVLIGGAWTPGYVASVSADGLGNIYVQTPFQLDFVATRYGIFGYAGARSVRLAFSSWPSDMWRSLTVDHELVFAAGMLGAYDGVEAIGYGFALGPEIDVAHTATSATGGFITAGDYLYNVVAERRSASGTLYRSPISIDFKVTTTGTTSTNTVGVMPTSSVGHSVSSPGAYVFYRSVKNGSIVQRIAFPPSDMAKVDASLAYPVTVIDINADSSVSPEGLPPAPLESRSPLYTVGGELEDFQPPSALTIAFHQNRIWQIAGDGTTVWLSKDRATNPGVAPGFNPALTFSFDRTLTALAPMDEKLIVFAADTFWIIFGQGPTPNGQNGTYEVAPVQTDVGCINPRSIVSTPDGIMFHASRGIYLLNRKIELSWIGRPVKDELGAGEITSAVLVAPRNEIRFTVVGYSASSPDTLRCVVLVYNYVEREWTTSTYEPEGDAGALITDAVMWRGAWTAVTDSGVVFSEASDTYLDVPASGSGVMATEIYETAWINAGGPLSFQSVRNFSLEGVAKSALSLTIEAGFDSDDAYPQSKTFNVTAAEQADYEISIGTRRKCHAIRFRLTVAAPSEGETTGEGLALSMLGIEVGGKRGFAKKPAQKTG